MVGFYSKKKNLCHLKKCHLFLIVSHIIKNSHWLCTYFPFIFIYFVALLNTDYWEGCDSCDYFTFMQLFCCCFCSFFVILNDIFCKAVYISVANNGQSSAIAYRLRTLVGKKKLEITKMTDHFSHTQKRILKLPNLKDLFF